MAMFGGTNLATGDSRTSILMTAKKLRGKVNRLFVAGRISRSERLVLIREIKRTASLNDQQGIYNLLQLQKMVANIEARQGGMGQLTTKEERDIHKLLENEEITQEEAHEMLVEAAAVPGAVRRIQIKIQPSTETATQRALPATVAGEERPILGTLILVGAGGFVLLKALKVL